MTIHHHPSDETLLRLAAGTLGAGPALVVTVHLEKCAPCRQRATQFDVVGGAMLEDMPPVLLAADSLGRTMAQLDGNPTEPVKRPTPTRGPELGIELPHALAHCAVGPWRWLGPGFQWSKIIIAESPDAKVMLLKGRAGLHLPAHGHTGLEVTQILYGSLSDERGEYFPGDMDEADEDVDHAPVVGKESACICIAALEGDTRLHGLLGRLLRPIVGF